MTAPHEPRTWDRRHDRVAVGAARDALLEIAHDLRWTWYEPATALFHDLDPDAWDASRHNPERLLARLPDARLAQLLHDRDAAERVADVAAELAALRADTTGWFPETHPSLRLEVALFAAEFGIADCLPISAGGLGAVAGEQLKTASELGVPMTGVGLRYGEASRQWLDRAGRQHETWEPLLPADLPMVLVRDHKGGFPLEVRVPLPEANARARVWEVTIGRSRLLLVDADVPGNAPGARAITRRLYPTDPELRLRQYLMLGIGGYEALTALRIEPDVVHCNEGHAALGALAHIGAVMQRRNLDFDQARVAAAPSLLFTTHTPVAAGHDYFPSPLAERLLAPIAASLGISAESLVALGRHDPGDPGDTFCPTVLALRLARHRNGVSRLHGSVTRQMWRGLWPRTPLHEIPIGHVTNGVHLESWVSPEMRAVLSDAIGPAWLTRPLDRSAWARARSIDDRRAWAARAAGRARLVRNARGWLALQAARRARRVPVAGDPAARLDPDALTIGFVGRFVAYKRPTLFLTDPERLARIVGDDARPVQIVFAGRAHPSDFNGKDLLRDVVRFARDAGLSHRIVFLEDFDIAMDEWLSQGVDVWLNTPRRPDEACGIAGMKAGINGALNFSTLDGWWDEAWRAAEPGRPPIGWVIGDDTPHVDLAAHDAADAESFYDVLEHQIVPAFYSRDADGLPRAWLAAMKESLATLGPVWTSTRMVREYTEQHYLPGRAAARALRKRNGARARDLARYLARVRAAWSLVRVDATTSERDATGDAIVRAHVHLGALSPTEVDVQVWADRGDGRHGSAAASMTARPTAGQPHQHLRYEARIPAASAPPNTVFAVRVLPRHPDLDDPMSTGCVAWSE